MKTNCNLCLFILFQFIDNITSLPSLPEKEQISCSQLPGPSASYSKIVTPVKEVLEKRKVNVVEDGSNGNKEVKKTKLDCMNDIPMQTHENNLSLIRLTNTIEKNNKQLELQNENLEKLKTHLLNLETSVIALSETLRN